MSSENLKPLSGEILDIDNALEQSVAKVALASNDLRLQAIVERVAASEDNTPDYQFIGELLFDVQKHYTLSPRELVEAYSLCEQRYEYVRKELINE